MLLPFKRGVHILGVIRVSNLGKLFFTQKYFKHMKHSFLRYGRSLGNGDQFIIRTKTNRQSDLHVHVGNPVKISTLLGGVDKRFQNL